MKTRLLILIALFFIGLNSEITAQKTNRKIERTIDGTTYICDTISGTVYNKSNIIPGGGNECMPEFKQTVPFIDICRKVFSKEKAELLIKNNEKNEILLFFCCDSTGRILEITFYLKNNYHLVTLQEIKELEDNLKKYFYKFEYICPEQKYYKILWPLKFKRLAQP